jgi:hypothetical protein
LLELAAAFDVLSGQIQLDADQSVRHAVALVFRLFRQLGSVRGVLTYLAREGLELPSQRLVRGVGRGISWQKPRYHVIYLMLTNPMYASIYPYGRRQVQVDPLAKSRQVHRKGRADWEVFLPQHHVGYISQEEYEANRASAGGVDVLVEDLFLSLMNVGTLEQSRGAAHKLQEEAALVDRQWQEKLQRLSYQADLARRRYEAVDPANRLVAQTLETAWNERLVELEAAQHAYRQNRPTPDQLRSTQPEMEQVVTHLRDYWYQESVSNQEKKDLLRCVIERVTLETHTSGKVIRAEIGWQGGATSIVEVPKYLFSAPHLFYRIMELARSLTDGQIAEALNAQGLQTASQLRSSDDLSEIAVSAPGENVGTSDPMVCGGGASRLSFPSRDHLSFLCVTSF